MSFPRLAALITCGRCGAERSGCGRGFLKMLMNSSDNSGCVRGVQGSTTSATIEDINGPYSSSGTSWESWAREGGVLWHKGELWPKLHSSSLERHRSTSAGPLKMDSKSAP